MREWMSKWRMTKSTKKGTSKLKWSMMCERGGPTSLADRQKEGISYPCPAGISAECTFQICLSCHSSEFEHYQRLLAEDSPVGELKLASYSWPVISLAQASINPTVWESTTCALNKCIFWKDVALHMVNTVKSGNPFQCIFSGSTIQLLIPLNGAWGTVGVCVLPKSYSTVAPAKG